MDELEGKQQLSGWEAHGDVKLLHVDVLEQPGGRPACWQVEVLHRLWGAGVCTRPSNPPVPRTTTLQQQGTPLSRTVADREGK